MKTLFLLLLIATLTGCRDKVTHDNLHPQGATELSDEALLDSVQHRTFRYFWDGAAPCGMAHERYHVDGDYPQNDSHIIATGGSGFGILAILAGIERHYITSAQGLERFQSIVAFLEKAETFHGVFPHWMEEDGNVKPFGRGDDGGDIVETAFLFQGLLAVQQYYRDGNEAEKDLSNRIRILWEKVEWDWYCNQQDVLFWHWSPKYAWGMNFPIRGYNECLIAYVLAASSPTHPIPATAYHKGWAEEGRIIAPHRTEGYDLNLRYQGTQAGPLFWAHYSFLGLNPNGLKDAYADYFQEMRHYTLINRAYCIRNPKGYKGYGADCWGLTAGYSPAGYAAHEPTEEHDKGVISPTAAISSIVYTPDESLAVIRKLYGMGDKVWGMYGFYDAFSETDDWYPQRYLAIDQGTTAVMIENYRSRLLWRLFMSHPDIQHGLHSLSFTISE